MYYYKKCNILFLISLKNKESISLQHATEIMMQLLIPEFLFLPDGVLYLTPYLQVKSRLPILCDNETHSCSSGEYDVLYFIPQIMNVESGESIRQLGDASNIGALYPQLTDDGKYLVTVKLESTMKAQLSFDGRKENEDTYVKSSSTIQVRELHFMGLR